MTMRHLFIAAACSLALTSCSEKNGMSDELPGLKDVFGEKFSIAVAVNDDQARGIDSVGAAIIRKNFNCIVAENVMKSDQIHPERDHYDWDGADAFVKFGEDNGMEIIGHTLVWHCQLAPWFPCDERGNQVTADTLKQRMRDHIHAVMGRYKGRIKGWDVVNEALVDGGHYVESPFYTILGKEYIPFAFQCAMEADPDAELYINDYGLQEQAKRDTLIAIVEDLKARGLRIDGIGMQGH